MNDSWLKPGRAKPLNGTLHDSGGLTGVLFPRRHANASGRLRLSDSSYRQMLRRWLVTCDIRDEHGNQCTSRRTNGGTPSPAD